MINYQGKWKGYWWSTDCRTVIFEPITMWYNVPEKNIVARPPVNFRHFRRAITACFCEPREQMSFWASRDISRENIISTKQNQFKSFMLWSAKVLKLTHLCRCPCSPYYHPYLGLFSPHEADTSWFLFSYPAPPSPPEAKIRCMYWFSGWDVSLETQSSLISSETLIWSWFLTDLSPNRSLIIIFNQVCTYMNNTYVWPHTNS